MAIISRLVLTSEGALHLLFDRPITKLDMTPTQARRMAADLLEAAGQADKVVAMPKAPTGKPS